MKQILIIGGAGFIGSNAALYFRSRGWNVVILDNLSRPGTATNLRSLLAEIDVKFIDGDVRNSEEVNAVFKNHSKLDAVLHLAAQVAVTTSVIDPVNDFHINALGTLNVLEALRRYAPRCTLLYSSTNKVYGELEHRKVVMDKGRYRFEGNLLGINEDEPLDFHSPYGCSKGAADQYVRDYARIYGLRTFVIRQSCIYGTRQYGVEDQGWVAWFTIAAVLGKPITIYGDGRQVRDVLWVGDLLELYERCINSGPESGVYNAGGGLQNSVSVREVLGLLETKLERKFKTSYGEWRPGDQKLFISDNTKSLRELGWCPTTSTHQGIEMLTEWVDQNKQTIKNAQTEMTRITVPLQKVAISNAMAGSSR
jgi:CDP-paratose 2-epimerase